MKKKVLHLNTNLDLSSGVTRYIELLSKNLSDDFEHHVITFQGNTDKDFTLDTPIHVHKIKTHPLVGKFIAPLTIWRYIKRNGIDIVHSHHRYMDFVASVISRTRDIRTITTVHSKVYGKKKMSYKSSTLVAVSKSMKDHLVNYYRVNDNRIRLINNFVDGETVVCKRSRLDMRLQIGIGPDEILLGFVGRIDIDEKGIDLLVNGFEIAKKRYNNSVRLMLVGNGKDLELVKRMDLEKNLKIVFVSATKNVFDYFQCIDLFVLPSRIDPFPYAMLEAAELKIPIVASNVGGISEFIDDGINGVLFEKGNANDLIIKIEYLMKDSKLRRELAERLHRNVVDNYSKKKIVPFYKHLYNSKQCEQK